MYSMRTFRPPIKSWKWQLPSHCITASNICQPGIIISHLLGNVFQINGPKEERNTADKMSKMGYESNQKPFSNDPRYWRGTLFSSHPDLTSPKFLMDTDLFIAWVSAPLWLENGKTQAIYFRHQKSSQSPLRLPVDGVWLARHTVSETSSKPAEEKTQAKSTASCLRQYHPSLLTSGLNTVC